MNPQAQHEYGMSHEDYMTFIANGLKWSQLAAAGNIPGQSQALDNLHADNDALRKKYGIPEDAYPKFHGGGLVAETGPAILKEDEMVLPVKYKRVMDDLSILVRTPDIFRQMMGNGSRGQTNVAIDTVMRIDNAVFESGYNAEEAGHLAGVAFRRALSKRGV
jgi:hypothetical protein